jgi:hypothetical protein
MRHTWSSENPLLFYQSVSQERFRTTAMEYSEVHHEIVASLLCLEKLQAAVLGQTKLTSSGDTPALCPGWKLP